MIITLLITKSKKIILYVIGLSTMGEGGQKVDNSSDKVNNF
jgi:hypothetical protein